MLFRKLMTRFVILTISNMSNLFVDECTSNPEKNSKVNIIISSSHKLLHLNRTFYNVQHSQSISILSNYTFLYENQLKYVAVKETCSWNSCFKNGMYTLRCEQNTFSIYL